MIKLVMRISKKLTSILLAVLLVSSFALPSSAGNRVIDLGFDKIKISTPTDTVTLTAEERKTCDELGIQMAKAFETGQKQITFSVPSQLTSAHDKDNLAKVIRTCGLQWEQNQNIPQGGFFRVCVSDFDHSWNGNRLTLTIKNLLTDQQYASMLSAAQQLSKQLTDPNKSDEENLRTYYDWLGTHVSYNEAFRDRYVSTMTSGHTPYPALVPGANGKRTALCGGFAGTMYLIARAAGINLYCMVGDYTDVSSYHMWNVFTRKDGTIVKIDAANYNSSSSPNVHFCFTKGDPSHNERYIPNIRGNTFLDH